MKPKNGCKITLNITKHNIEHQGCTHLYSVLTVNHLALQRSTFSTNSLFSACISHGQNPWPCVLEVKVLILELFSINGFAPSTIALVFWMQTYTDWSSLDFCNWGTFREVTTLRQCRVGPMVLWYVQNFAMPLIKFSIFQSPPRKRDCWKLHFDMMTIANENTHSLSQSSLAHELRDDPMEFGTFPAWPACQVMKHKMRRSGWNLQNMHQYHECCTFVAESHFPSAQCPEVLRLKQEASRTSIIQLPTSMAQNRYSDTKQSEGATVFGTWSALSKSIFVASAMPNSPVVQPLDGHLCAPLGAKILWVRLRFCQPTCHLLQYPSKLLDCPPWLHLRRMQKRYN